MDMQRIDCRRIGWTTWHLPTVGMIAGALVGCDFSVLNPGPVADELLDDAGAHAAIVEGASFSLSEALWQYSFVSAETVHEITRAGRNFAGPKSPPREGELSNDGLAAGFWNSPQESRWVAEDASRRFGDVLGVDADSYPLNARAKLIAGHANRLLGENACAAVIDGGPIEPHTVWFERADAAFKDAIEIGEKATMSELVMAATAGRAQVLGPGLGRWSEAVSFSQQVPDEFAYQAIYAADDDSQFNHIVYITDGDSWRDLTVLGTFFEDYYLEIGDPRVRWDNTGRTDTPQGLLLLRQRKWTNLDDDVNLSSGREMRLIEAEALLRDGNWRGTMDILNGLRANVVSDQDGQPIPGVSASNLEEAWTLLKQERRIELWLEGRRLYDLRRWIEEGIPGVQEDMSHRMRLCFPVSQSEINSNPNIPSDYEDPFNPTYVGG